VVGTHGALPEEQVRAQPFEIDLDVWLDLAHAGATDDLEQTLDYGSLTERVASVVSSERVALLERLAQRIADVALDDERVTQVAVTVRKLRPPVPVDLDTAAVTIVRSR
jgi:7,8-dihydroneopterin aldolase/epimerase/oxygenase